MKIELSNQLTLFQEPAFTPKKKLIYNDLTIHQKINHKANLCGFSNLVYGMYYQLGIRRVDLRYYPIDRLTKDYAWHYERNSGGDNRLDNYRKKKEGRLL